ncbi:MAG: B12-binding domain-containing radical SAM protein [Thermoplasmata archaeon]|nr:B12-binding domain-containing radical SAM protein [Candidatus Sysuiplasma jiujiangense]
MRTVLIRPTNPSGSAYLTKWGFLPAPLGLLQLAGELQRLDNSSIRIIDMEAESMTVERVLDEISAFRPDMIGITIHATAAHGTSCEIARRVKQRFPDTVIVAGGHHATFLPNDLLREGFDIVVLGEGDFTFAEIASAVDAGTDLGLIPGIVYKAKGKFVRTGRRGLIEDLDTLAFPALELIDASKYTFSVFGKESRVLCLETSRGCPYACDFCSVTPTWGNKWRNKSNARIIEEMHNAEKFGYDWIFFTDDIFIVFPNTKQRALLFRSMMDNGFDFRWIVQMRADVTAKNPELIRKGAEAGMSVAFMGIESGSQEILRKMHKGIFTPQSVDAVRILSGNGVIVLCGMMIGAPYERLRDMITTVRFSNKLADAGADAVQFSIYTPLPGTRVFDDALRNGRLFTLDWDRYDVLTPVMKTKVHPAVVQLVQFYANYSFYVRKYLLSKMGRRAVHERKEKLVSDATRFIFEMMPEYIRDMTKFPAQLIRTSRLYASLARNAGIAKDAVAELMENSNSVIYLQKPGTANPYFRIKQEQ